MTALLGGGGLLGAVLAARVLHRGSQRILALAFAGSAIGLALAGAAPVLALALGGMAIAGAGRGLGDVAATTLIQERARDEVRSRVFAAQDGAAHSCVQRLRVLGRAPRAARERARRLRRGGGVRRRRGGDRAQRAWLTGRPVARKAAANHTGGDDRCSRAWRPSRAATPRSSAR